MPSDTSHDMVNSLSGQECLQFLYDELRRLAAAKLALEAPGQTLPPTALVHEAYLRIMQADPERPWGSQRDFLIAAAEAMRRILIDRARAKRSHKRGGEMHRVALSLALPAPLRAIEDQIAFDEVLSRLEAHHAMAAQYIKLRFFVGFSHHETADALQLTRREADRVWKLGRAWVFRELARES
ncbi:MAG: RNA polymerase subunit sigma [Planctomycetales bacterium]|nr:RNA polymerase subunit sigma [Planctomycetales bacterium]